MHFLSSAVLLRVLGTALFVLFLPMFFSLFRQYRREGRPDLVRRYAVMLICAVLMLVAVPWLSH